MKKPHIIIVGGGFGGVYTAKNLIPAVKKGLCEVTLVSQDNYFLFTPLLHEVATGTLSAGSVIESLRDIFSISGIEILEAKVDSVDETKKCVTLANGSCLDFDYLVIATGAETAYYNVEGAQEFGIPLKTLSDAISLRLKIIDAFEEAGQEKNPEIKKELLTFVVVGGGPTGVELVSELREFADDLFKSHARTFDDIGYEKPRIIMISASPDLLPMFHAKIRGFAEEILFKENIECLLGKTVQKIEKNKLTFADGESISTRFVVWTAGVVADATCAKHMPLTKGRIQVDEFLRTKSPNVFAIGDVACTDMSSGTPPAPMLAQIAEQEAEVCADNIVASILGNSLQKYEFKIKAMLISLGKWQAAGQIGPINITGPFAWWVWRTVYLFKFASRRKQIRIMFEWTLDLFASRDISRIK